MKLEAKWDKVFPQSDKIDHKKVTFVNHYGITIAADVYMPKNLGDKKVAALAVSGPFGAVKEQSSGLYAQTMAEKGFITVAFDPSFTGESGGEPRNTASVDINTEVDRGGVPVGDYHEHPVIDGKVISGEVHMLPETLPADADAVTKQFFDYYRTERGYHQRAINSNGMWNDTIQQSFFNFELLDHINEIAPRPVLMIAGSDAHFLYYSQDAYDEIKEQGNAELMIIPGANHVDLYDRVDVIPFDKLDAFFKANLK